MERKREGRKKQLRAGPPFKYNGHEHCAFATEYLAAGHSVHALAGALGVHTDTLRNWEQQFPEFHLAVTNGRNRAIALYEDKLLDVINGKTELQGHAVGALRFALINRGREAWSDRVVQEHVGDNALIHVEVNRRPESLSDEELAELLESSRRAKEILVSPLPDEPEDGADE